MKRGDSISEIARECHETAKDHGFWDEVRNQGELIALMHSELSECLEALRHNNPPDEHCPEHSSASIELADCIIRILDACYAYGWDIEGALMAKMAYNKGRARKHGKEF